MSSKSSKASSIGSDIKGAVKSIHGTGEAVRGTLNQAVDETFHDTVGEVKNRSIAEKGMQDVKAGNQRIEAQHGAKNTIRTGGVGNAATTGGSTTDAGAHSGAVGNLHSNPASTNNMQEEPEGMVEKY